jgi:hypothetical protein
MERDPSGANAASPSPSPVPVLEAILLDWKRRLAAASVGAGSTAGGVRPSSSMSTTSRVLETERNVEVGCLFFFFFFFFFVDFSFVMIHDPLDPEFFLRTNHVLRIFYRLFLLHNGT